MKDYHRIDRMHRMHNFSYPFNPRNSMKDYHRMYRMHRMHRMHNFSYPFNPRNSMKDSNPSASIPK